ncbi:transcriptional attenuator, LytR family [Pelagirhabdus alkalitolerans]|uniref:Transcriptional attenuator, LytR family n=1 Tax=Pelagirhabdus alkalitolerans TaxID=1612202 RepID=A0A1G6GHB3_9BACI|nr:LCP family protein [Pelagirhabdus alkalitolerans]SDB81223.1 transcriptional attenuator, LytR family [Pelagirhabdus alkalitolerans]
MKKKEQVNSRSMKRKSKKRSRKRKLLLFVLVPILLLVTATSVYAFNIFNRAQQAVDNAYEDDGRDRSELRDFDVDPDHDHVSILFLGIDENDQRDNAGSALSDSMILATLNKDDNSVKLTSIPRDSYVYIPEVGYYDKINHAHAFGGARASIEAVEGFLDVPVDYYARFNFQAFVDVVDALGGVDFDVPYEFTESNSDDQRDAIHLLPGEQRVDGEEALALARTRKLDSDLARGERQQELMESILDRAVSIGSINRINDVIDAVGDNMTTSLSFDDMMSFISYGMSGDLDVEMINLEGSDLWLDGIYYYQLDEQHLAEVQNKLQVHLDILDEDEEMQPVNEDAIGGEEDRHQTDTDQHIE